ncbi:hypothetical protein HISP_02880 [Haloarcula hispanica N601]|uniref:DUF4013 domain-containing protein n=2 Tax=Haloarcula hispanica TaxID=51589 RepID=V5TJ35_HALHI|nr:MULTISPECIES: DUF4013 domain-containing protein [Haloarcula]AEM56180.1 conserved hypothetical protein [Haloarcula hispanica ATCC 33960]AHB64992.1 hypothetical protein HISP_02880 [Haloarcula hispanica N601]KZX48992.1 hypothetical protein AV929_18880 [Haloarcula sp. K1]
MIEDALRYQTQGDDWVKRVALGGVVLFFGFLIVPLFTFQGYMLEVMRRVLRGETDTPPAWDELDLTDITVDGIRHTVVVMGYGLLLTLALAVPGLLVIGGGLGGSEGLLLVGFLVAALLYLIGVLAMAVILPVATGNFVRADSIAAGFDRDVLSSVGTSRTMLMAVVMAFAVNVIVSVGATILGFTIVGYLAVPFLAFVGQSAIMYVWGRGFADAYEEEYGEPPLAPTTATGGTHGSGPATTGTTPSVDEPIGDSDTDQPSWSDDTDESGFGTSAWDDAGDGDSGRRR